MHVFIYTKQSNQKHKQRTELKEKTTSTAPRRAQVSCLQQVVEFSPLANDAAVHGTGIFTYVVIGEDMAKHT